jgi:phosphohistidine phosphatase
MRRLTLIRHAKSSHGDPSLPDRLRPLHPRGQRDAPLMGRHLQEMHQFRPGLLISSPAIRTLTTARAIAAEMENAPAPIQVEERIYEAPVSALLAVVQSLPDTAAHVCLTGHNPGTENFTNWLCGQRAVTDVVTCAVIMLELNIAAWAETGPGCARLRHYITPALLGLTKELD